MLPLSGVFKFCVGIIATLLVIRLLNIAVPISVTSKNVSGELSVVGEGKVDVVPDTAEVSAGIVAEGSTVESVEKKINEVNNSIVNALTRLGISKEDIKTSNYSISPNYNYETGTNTISGYLGNATLTIKVKKTEQLPQTITAATTAGANQIYNTQYSVDDPSKYRGEARKKAIQNAKDQAEKITRELGIKLGKVVNIVESSPESSPPYTIYAERNVGGALPEPDLQAGTQTITSVVTLYFEKR